MLANLSFVQYCKILFCRHIMKERAMTNTADLEFYYLACCALLRSYSMIFMSPRSSVLLAEHKSHDCSPFWESSVLRQPLHAATIVRLSRINSCFIGYLGFVLFSFYDKFSGHPLTSLITQQFAAAGSFFIWFITRLGFVIMSLIKYATDKNANITILR